MAGINHLKEIKERRGDDFLAGLFNNYVIINEKTDGSFFGVKKTISDTFKYFKKSGEISYVDRVLMKYYNPVIKYFDSLSDDKKNKIPANLYFGFEYFANGDTNTSKYDRLPKNGLVLSYIHKLSNTGDVIETLQSSEQLNKWADFLEVECPPILFEGNLDEDQKKDILEFVYSNEDDLFDKFKTTSFTKYLISILCPDKKQSFLKDTIGESIDGIIFRFYNVDGDGDDAKVFLAKLIDPIFRKRIEETPKAESKSQDYIWLIVIDLVNYFEMYNIDQLRQMANIGSDFDQKYLNLVNQVFKDFIRDYHTKYDGLLLDVPEYLTRPEFQLNIDLIKDKEVVNLVKKNDTYLEIYKILLNFFRKNRKKSPAGFFNDMLLSKLNQSVSKIRDIIMGNELYESIFPSFSQFIGSDDTIALSETEAVDSIKKKINSEKVNILVGNFQPISLGHIKAAKQLFDKNGLKVILISVKPEKVTQKSPFSSKLTTTLLNKVKSEYSDIIRDIKVISKGQIESILSNLRPEYEPILWGTSERRINDYLLQMDYIKKRELPLRLAGEFKLVQLEKYIKSDQVLDSIKSENLAEFKQLVPQSIVSEFFNLVKELNSKLNESEEDQNFLPTLKYNKA